VNNVAPTVGEITVSLDPVSGLPVETSASFSDPGADSWTATWDWGNGDNTNGDVSDYVALGSYTYDTPGVYTITLTVTDDDGGMGSNDIDIIVEPPIKVLSANMNIYNDIIGAGDGSAPDTQYEHEVFIGAQGDLSTFDINDLILTVDEFPLVHEYAEITYDGGDKYSIYAGGSYEGIPLYGEYVVSIQDTAGQVSNPFTIGNLNDHPKDAPDILYPQHESIIPETQPTFNWAPFESIYLGQPIENWGTQVSIAWGGGGGQLFRVWPIDPNQFSLDYVNPDWKPYQPPPLEPGYHHMHVHSHHDVAPGFTFEQTRRIAFYVNQSPISDAGGPYSGDEGVAIAISGASASDPDEDTLSFSWSVDNPVLCSFDDSSLLNPNLTCTDNGVFEVTLTVDDGVNDPVSDSTTVTVQNMIPIVNMGGDETINEGATFSRSGSFTDPGADTWMATVDYGDGAGAIPLDLAPDKSFILEHPYGDNGVYAVTVTITDDDGGVGISEIQITVQNVIPTVIMGGDETINEGDTFSRSGSFTDPGADTWTATVDYGDGTGAIPLDLAPDKSFTLEHPYGDNGVYPVTVTITDDDGGVGIGTITVTVLNVAPTVGDITAPIDPMSVDWLIETSAPFSDPGFLDTHTAIWDWGNGQTTEGIVDNYTVSGSYAYDTPGVYTITCTVTDDDGGVGTSTYSYVVIYDPDGGFVTGGGWIWSPLGAYSPDPSLEGKSNFGLVAKYKKGADVPSGETEFRFKLADLNFHSTNYDWLVVAGKKAQYKGLGTINGEGEYKFMLMAIDGDLPGGDGLDKFRIKIWEEDDQGNETVIYDNQPGADEDIDPITELGGGSIVIHTAK
jgi:PKD repeat protein